MSARRAHRWLALLPALAICVGVPLVDRLHASLFGVPLLLVWIVGTVLMTSAVMAVIAALDRRPPRP
jgi:4-hydroxybenzoate polyprenyltransferase